LAPSYGRLVWLALRFLRCLLPPVESLHNVRQQLRGGLFIAIALLLFVLSSDDNGRGRGGDCSQRKLRGSRARLEFAH
jgi:hypothetical protein